MISSTRNYLIDFLRTHDGFKNMLDVGSLNISGTILENVPEGCKYTGIDMQEGENVDIVLNGHDLVSHFGGPSFDLIVCFDTFEHDREFWKTWDNMKQILLPGGYIVLGVPARHCPLHLHPSDYWRFMEPSFKEFFFTEDYFDDIDVKMHYFDNIPNGFENEICGYGRKK